MKRMVLIAALLLGTGLNAHADIATYHNILKTPRNDDQLHEDGYYCDAQVGPDKNGVPTPRLISNACSAAAGAIGPSNASRLHKPGSIRTPD